MDILSYLTDLLKTRKEVGIEGLGTFFKHKIPGRYDVVNHLFLPPSYTLDIRSEVDETESLNQYISSSANISSESARHFISLFVEDINRQLAISNEADLDSLGTLSYSNAILTLTQQGRADVGTQFYGLPIVGEENVNVVPQNEDVFQQDELIQQEDVNEQEEVTQHQAEILPDSNDDQEVFDEIAEPLTIVPVESTPEIETEEKLIEEEPGEDILPEQKPVADKPVNIWQFDKDKSITNNNLETESEGNIKSGTPFWAKVLIGLLVIGVIIAAAYFLKPAWFGQENKAIAPIVSKDTVVSTVQPVQIDTTGTDSLDSNAATNQANNLDTSKAVITATTNNVVDSTTWEIIAASLTRGEVKQYIIDMKARGYTVKPVTNMPGKRRIKMSIATFSDEESAIAGRKLLIKKLKNKDLYIFQNKNTQKPL